MRKNIIALFELMLGLLIAIGPYSIFKVCGSEKVMRCTYSCRVEIVFGILIVVCALLLCRSNEMENENNLYLVIMYANVSGVLIIKYLIGGCAALTMRCQLITFPSLFLLNVFCFCVSFCGLLINLVKKKRG